jgi:dihydrofolate synthase/folylpolyglutamate synthase
VSGWAERIWVDGAEGDFERAIARVRAAAEELGATQFETLTAAAFAEFAERGVQVAAVEAGLGGRLDATNVVDAPVVLLTNVTDEHADVLGDSPEAIAREKLAVAKEGSIVVLPDETYAPLVHGNEIRYGGARTAAEAFVGHEITREVTVALPGRLEDRGAEIRDGAHNPDGVRFLVERLPAYDFTLVVSILADKDAGKMLESLRQAGSRLVATASSSARSLPAAELARLARPHFDYVEAVEPPVSAVERAHELGEPVLVTGSLYLLGDLAQAEQER